MKRILLLRRDSVLTVKLLVRFQQRKLCQSQVHPGGGVDVMSSGLQSCREDGGLYVGNLFVGLEDVF